MKVSYEDEDIETLCKQEKMATKKLGPESAKKLQRRLAELHAAGVVGELAIGRPHPLDYDRVRQFAVDLHKGKRLIFKPTSKPPPAKADGSIDWSKVSEITIIGAEDYHD
ncbi:killer suppression protein HigA [Propionivibrio sp.]|uniref:type II toxin-antitoxin system RelE/ParE family toxin n=1 Tax=Propionivibrio sp. TaxID=2212460 RepID=UPI00262B8CDE|nr:killer suppression protein HigA [Propionivibrio sp.]